MPEGSDPDPQRPGPDPGRRRHARPGMAPITPPGGGFPLPRPSRAPAPGSRHARPDATQRRQELEAPTEPALPAVAAHPPPVRPGRRPRPAAPGQAGPGQAGPDEAGTEQPTGTDRAGTDLGDDARDGTGERVARPRRKRRPQPGPSPDHHAHASGHTSGHGHGHGHGHGPALPAGRRVRIFIAALLVPCGVAALIGLVVLWPTTGRPAPPAGAETPVHADVVSAQVTDCAPGSGDGRCVAVGARTTDGPLPGNTLTLVVPVEPSTPRFGVGDKVVLGWNGADPNDPGGYRIADFQRPTPLLWLTALFAAAVLVLGRWRGLAALAALVLSFAVLLTFVLPAILAGRDPLAVAVVGACLIMFAILYLTHGFSARTSTAVLGTLLSLALIGALGTLFSVAAKLTGLDDQTSNLIAALGGGIDARGLLLAGIVIGALGVLDDVTVTQTSAVWELRRANPDLGAPALFAAAMRIGRDHVSSAVNTLVLAYAGASLPLLLIFSLSGRGLGDVVTSQEVATEIVRTLVGSIGLVASVPITTALAAVVASRETKEALLR